MTVSVRERSVPEASDRDPPVPAAGRRARRFDPDRRERILVAALEVIASHGVAGTTHRRVAAAADVPLGSMTYHFASLDEVLREAFTRHAAAMAADHAACFEGVRTRADLLAALTRVVHGDPAPDRARSGLVVGAPAWTVTYELYLAASRDPALRTVTEGWMRASRAVLERYVDPGAAAALDALVEGLAMHSGLSTGTPDRDRTRAAFARLLATVATPALDRPATPTTTPTADEDTRPA